MEKEKKSFETPEAEVFQYGDQDIITQSNEPKLVDVVK